MGNTKTIMTGLALALFPLLSLAATGGKIVKVDFTPGKDLSLLTVNYSGQGSFRVFQSEQQNNVILEAENLVLPAALTRSIDASASNGPVVQVTPYNSGDGKKSISKFVVQLRQKAEVSSSDQPGRYTIEIRRKSLLGSGAAKSEKASDEFKFRASANDKTEEISKKLVEVLNAPPAEKNYFGSKVTFEASNADVHDIFRLVGESSGLNIITDSDVSAKSNFSLKDIPWDQLLDIVIQQANLKAIINGNVIRIISLDKFNKDQEAKLRQISLGDELEPVIMAVIPLSYAKADEMSKMIDALLKKDVVQSAGTDAATAAASMPAASTTSTAAGGAPASDQPRKKLVQDFVRGQIQVDTRSNSLVVTNVKDAIERIRRLVKELDVPLPQVLIDAKVVIASEGFSKSTGISWGGKMTSLGTGRAGAGAGFNGGGVMLGAAESANAAPAFPIAGGDGGLGVGFQLGTGRHGNLSAVLKLTESSNLSKTIASPRIIVNNKYPAKITDGQTSFIPTLAGANATGTVQAVTANLDLTVTPQVTSSGSVLLSVDIKKDSFDRSPLPGATTSTNTKALNTEVLVESGSTLVLGGVYQYITGKVESGIPVLKDLPFLGQLFRSNTDDNSKSELMVFITPQIMSPEGVSDKAEM